MRRLLAQSDCNDVNLNVDLLDILYFEVMPWERMPVETVVNGFRKSQFFLRCDDVALD